MTHYPNIHLRAEQLVRESRGRLTLRAAYRELSARSAAAKRHAPAAIGTSRQVHAWQTRADLA